MNRVAWILLTLALAFATPAGAANEVLRFQIPFGSFDAELCTEVSSLCTHAAPDLVANFTLYVNDGSYTGVVIHRSSPGFVIQGGGFRLTASGLAVVTTHDPIQPSLGQPNRRGTFSMAKNSAGDATSQWFINLVDTFSTGRGSGSSLS